MGVIANMIEQCGHKAYPHCIAEMPSGFAVLNERQPDAIVGCCMLLPKVVVASPNDLNHTQRAGFFSDLVLLGDAIMQVTGSARVNYLVLCNQAPELHGHCIPRFETEDHFKRLQCPFQAYNFGDARLTDAEGVDKAMVYGLGTALQEMMLARDD